MKKGAKTARKETSKDLVDQIKFLQDQLTRSQGESDYWKDKFLRVTGMEATYGVPVPMAPNQGAGGLGILGGRPSFMLLRARQEHEARMKAMENKAGKKEKGA